MKLLRVAYRGMCGFAGGELDLRAIPPGLVTLAGPNWNGKTTLLELPLATWYREWASRETKNIALWADGRDSWIETECEIGTVVYRARVNIDGVSRKMQAVLSQQTVDGRWRQLNDGKVSTFDDLMTALIPPKDALLCSQFAAQNRAGSLTGASRAKRKDLFIHFLWLERMLTMSETAKACLQIADTTSLVLRSQIDGLLRESHDELLDALVSAETAASVEITQFGILAASQAESIAAWDAERRALAADVETYVQAAAQSTEVAAKLADTARELADLPNQADTAKQAFVAEVSRIERRLTQTRADLAPKIQKQRDVLASADLIRIAVDKAARWTAALESARTRLEAIATEQTELKQVLRDVGDAELIESVPCHGQSEFAGCKFLKNAITARDRVGARTEAEVRGGLQALDEEFKSRQAARREATQALQQVQPLAAMAPMLDQAEERLAEYEAATAKAEIDAAELAAAAQDVWGDTVRTLGELRDQLTVEQETLLDDQTRLAADVARTAGAKARVAELEAVLATLRDDRSLAEQQIATLKAEQRARTDAIAMIYEKRERVLRIEPKLRAVEAESRLQAFLMRAFHRDGLPTLEIAAAAPAISQLTTDLLEHSGFGTRFRVTVTTLVPTADGKEFKEDFAIRLYDNERGKELLDVGDLSGGERILVEEALRAALTIYMAARHTSQVRTCWRDETTGPLDADNRPKYIAMLRRLRELGGYDHVIFISQTEDTVNLADTIVDVRMGQATVRRVA